MHRAASSLHRNPSGCHGNQHRNFLKELAALSTTPSHFTELTPFQDSFKENNTGTSQSNQKILKILAHEFLSSSKNFWKEATNCPCWSEFRFIKFCYHHSSAKEPTKRLRDHTTTVGIWIHNKTIKKIAPSNGWCLKPKGLLNGTPTPIHVALLVEGPGIKNFCLLDHASNPPTSVCCFQLELLFSPISKKNLEVWN